VEVSGLRLSETTSPEISGGFTLVTGYCVVVSLPASSPSSVTKDVSNKADGVVVTATAGFRGVVVVLGGRLVGLPGFVGLGVVVVVVVVGLVTFSFLAGSWQIRPVKPFLQAQVNSPAGAMEDEHTPPC
jgi:hypothetical protein